MRPTRLDASGDLAYVQAVMAILPIITAPDPRLKKISDPVAVVDDAVRAQLADMLETMYAAPGVGLAAIQVGIPLRMLVIDVAREGEPPQPLQLINPEIKWASDEVIPYEEGCLSLPKHYADVERPAEIVVAYLDETGAAQERRCAGLLAVCVQHEMDHLDGILFVDHISSLKRAIIMKKLQKAKVRAKEDAEDA